MAEDQMGDIEKDMKNYSNILQFAKNAKKRARGRWTITIGMPGVATTDSAGRSRKMTKQMFEWLESKYIPNTATIGTNHLIHTQIPELAQFGIIESVRVAEDNLEADIKIKEKWLNTILENELHEGFSAEFKNVVTTENDVDMIAADLVGLTIVLSPGRPRCPKEVCDIVGFCSHSSDEIEVKEEESKETIGDENMTDERKCGCGGNETQQTNFSGKEGNVQNQTTTPPPPPPPKTPETETENAPVVKLKEVEEQYLSKIKEIETRANKEREELQKKLEEENLKAEKLNQTLSVYEARERQEIISKLPTLEETEYAALGANEPKKGWDSFQTADLKRFLALKSKLISEEPETSGAKKNNGVDSTQKSPEELRIEAAKNHWRNTLKR